MANLGLLLKMSILKSDYITPVGARPGLDPWDSAAMCFVGVAFIPSNMNPTKAAGACNAAKLNSGEMELK